MNDFTKPELEAIADELEGTLYKDLRDKIQSMIDNYCEHKWQINNQLKCNECAKCGEFYK